MPHHLNTVLLSLQPLCWNGHPEILAISLRIHSHPDSCTGLEHFQMSDGGTEASYSDDVA